MAVDTAPKLSALRDLGFAVETTTGTAVSIAGSDCVSAVYGDVPMIKFETEQVAREPQGSLSNRKQYRGARKATATFETDLVGNGASGLNIIANRLFAACGYAATGGVLAPLDSAVTTLTVAEWLNGKKRIAMGCMGDFVITASRGKPARVKWTFTGVQDAVAMVSQPTPTYVTIKPPITADAFTFGSTAYQCPEIVISAGNKVVLREDINAVDSAGNKTGYRAAMITGRRPTITFAPELIAVGTKDWIGDFRSLATGAFSLAIGTVANNIITIAAPTLQIDEDPAEGDREGLLTDALKFLAVGASTTGVGNELTITYS